MNDFEARQHAYRERVEGALQAALPGADAMPQHLHRAMRYACLGGGKRVRAMLVYASGELLGAAPTVLDVPATALEMIHAYSLVHDDLPAMDDDALRRGRPTCHRAFGEATAILAGDALQALAFERLAGDPALALDPARRGAMISRLAGAAGSLGMAGGQAIDLAVVNTTPDRARLTAMHRCKTGALIRAAVALGALCAVAPGAAELTALDQYAAAIGLAFQVVDDILDASAETATLGKSAGADAAQHKPTFVSVLGIDGARQSAAQLLQSALASLAPIGHNTQFLERLAHFIVARPY